MATVPHSMRVPEWLDKEIHHEMRRRGVRDWTSAALSLLEEAIRMNRSPGIVFVEGRSGRRSAVAFSGLEVWEIIATWREAGEDWKKLREAYSELSEAQLRAALNYYRLYPEEVDARLELEAYWTPERLVAELPFTQAGLTGRERS